MTVDESRSRRGSSGIRRSADSDGQAPVPAQSALALTASEPHWFAPYRAGLTHRGGGVSPPPYRSLNLGRWVGDLPANVDTNEVRIGTHLGLTGVARVRLEHGVRIVSVSEPGLHGPGDALLTRDPGLALSLTVADCVPVALAAGATRVLAHCGWRSTATGLLEGCLRALGEASGLAEAKAWIGPGIGACCYEVGPEVARRFPEAAIRRLGDRLHLDLEAAIRARLEGGGLAAAEVTSARECTACRSDLYFSHRRDGFPTGRMAAFFWRESAGADQDEAGDSTRAPGERSSER